MVILIGGATHTGKTLLAQRLLEKYHFPYLSMDHLKMGLIRSGRTDLTVFDNARMTQELWSIVREMIKTAIENGQNLIVEGVYIPFCWKQDFSQEYLDQIYCRFLVMSRGYIEREFSSIVSHANVIEHRLDDSDLNCEVLIRENERQLQMCRRYGCDYLLIDESYDIATAEPVF